MSDQILRVFIPSGKPLADGSFLRRNATPQHFSCHGDWLMLNVAGQRWRLRANVSAVSAGDRRQTISANGRKHEQTFPEAGTVLDLMVPEELRPIVRRVTLRRGIGLSTMFARKHYETFYEEELSVVALATESSVDAATRFELIEL